METDLGIQIASIHDLSKLGEPTDFNRIRAQYGIQQPFGLSYYHQVQSLS